MPRSLAILLLKAYKSFVSPILPPACRFQPTCSEYFRESVERYGVVRGAWLGIRRLLRCHPFSQGGFDPVPSSNLVSRGCRTEEPSERAEQKREAAADSGGVYPASSGKTGR